MSYCVNCGVKLGDSETRCPLCATTVYHPDAPDKSAARPPFPIPESSAGKQKVRPKSGLLIAALLLLLPTLLTFLCDYSINHRVVWSGIVLFSVLLLACIVFLPLLFPNRNSLCYLLPDFATCCLLQSYIERLTGGAWFLTFSLPLTSSVLLGILVFLLVRRRTKSSSLQLTALVFVLIGLECLLIEALLRWTFARYTHFIWSYYPLSAFIILGLVLFFINRNPRLKERFEKFFFL